MAKYFPSILKFNKGIEEVYKDNFLKYYIAQSLIIYLRKIWSHWTPNFRNLIRDIDYKIRENLSVFGEVW
jgi:hypothetical protein